MTFKLCILAAFVTIVNCQYGAPTYGVPSYNVPAYKMVYTAPNVAHAQAYKSAYTTADVSSQIYKPVYHAAPEAAPTHKPAYHDAPQAGPTYKTLYHDAHEVAPNYKPSYHDASEVAPAYKPAYHSAPEVSPTYKPAYHSAPEVSPTYKPAYHSAPEVSPTYKPAYHSAPEVSPTYKPAYHVSEVAHSYAPKPAVPLYVPVHSAHSAHSAPSHKPQSYNQVVPAYPDAHPTYKFAYTVHDPHTADIKSQEESRDGERVQGVYALVEADGSKRVVHYSDNGHGFQADVQKDTGVHVHPHYAQKYTEPAVPGYRVAGVIPTYKKYIHTSSIENNEHVHAHSLH